jgi:hypothetical protein
MVPHLVVLEREGNPSRIVDAKHGVEPLRPLSGRLVVRLQQVLVGDGGIANKAVVAFLSRVVTSRVSVSYSSPSRSPTGLVGTTSSEKKRPARSSIISMVGRSNASKASSSATRS